jgi:hypothetical protein
LDFRSGSMSVELRWEQCCETPGCTKPAHHGVLCAVCFYAASPARRAVELLGAAPDAAAVFARDEEYVSERGAAWLAQLWAA